MQNKYREVKADILNLFKNNYSQLGTDELTFILSSLVSDILQAAIMQDDTIIDALCEISPNQSHEISALKKQTPSIDAEDYSAAELQAHREATMTEVKESKRKARPAPKIEDEDEEIELKPFKRRAKAIEVFKDIRNSADDEVF